MFISEIVKNALLPIALVLEAAVVIAFFGMRAGIKGREADYRKARWQKYTGYVLIIHIMLISIAINALITAVVVVGFCLIEYILLLLKLGPAEKKRALLLVVPNIFVFTAMILSVSKLNPDHFFFVYYLIVIMDGYSQICGQLFGRKAIFPRLSPGKTLAGIIGGFVCTVGAAIGMGPMFAFKFPHSIVIGIFVVFFALAGDLFYSFQKRMFKIKDFSNNLFGQGGFLDRFDSMLISVPMFYLFSTVLVVM